MCTYIIIISRKKRKKKEKKKRNDDDRRASPTERVPSQMLVTCHSDMSLVSLSLAERKKKKEKNKIIIKLSSWYNIKKLNKCAYKFFSFKMAASLTRHWPKTRRERETPSRLDISKYIQVNRSELESSRN
jgi:hypothetical protein